MAAVTAMIDSCDNSSISLKVPNFLLLAKKQKTTYFVKDFSWFAKFLFNQFWSSYIAWLYIKRIKLHTKGPPLSALSLSLNPQCSKIGFTLLHMFQNSSILLHLLYKNISYYIAPLHHTSYTTPLHTIHLSHTSILWNFIILLPKNTFSSHSLFLIQNLPS